jgi:hypothetical protein
LEQEKGGKEINKSRLLAICLFVFIPRVYILFMSRDFIHTDFCGKSGISWEILIYSVPLKLLQ